MTDNHLGLRLGDAGTVLKTVPAGTVQTCVTSPPYWQLRNYSVPDEVGQEQRVEEYLQALVGIFSEVRRVLKSDGTLWLNVGDTYAGGGGYWPNAPSNKAGSKQSTNRGAKPEKRPVPTGCKSKDLLGIPWLLALALRQDGWFLRADVIWSKPDGFPEKVFDRPTRTHEYLFLFSKRKKYFYDPLAVAEPTANGKGKRNRRSVWSIAKTSRFAGSHTATFPEELVATCLLATSKKEDIVIDPFTGSGTTGVVAKRLGRKFLGVELSPVYFEEAKKRIEDAKGPDG